MSMDHLGAINAHSHKRVQRPLVGDSDATDDEKSFPLFPLLLFVVAQRLLFFSFPYLSEKEKRSICVLLFQF